MKPKFKTGDRIFAIKDDYGLSIRTFTIKSLKERVIDNKKVYLYTLMDGYTSYIDGEVFLYSKEALIDKIKEFREDRIVEINREYNSFIDKVEIGLEDGRHYY